MTISHRDETSRNDLIYRFDACLLENIFFFYILNEVYLLEISFGERRKCNLELYEN